MKHGGKKKRFRKQRSGRSGGPPVKAWPTLREFWDELQRAKRAGEPLPAAPCAEGKPLPAASHAADGSLPAAPRAAGGGAAQNAPAACAGGSFRSSGSGSGSGGSGGSAGGGYGLALIAPDPASQERIRRIMRSLCEKDAERRR